MAFSLLRWYLERISERLTAFLLWRKRFVLSEMRFVDTRAARKMVDQSQAF